MDAAKFRNHLIGTWALQSFVTFPENEPKNTTNAMGPSPQGFIMYTQDGYVGVHLQKPGQASYKNLDFMNGTDEEAAESARNYQAYCGPFKVVEDNGNLVLWHTMELALFPTMKGDTQKRLAKLDLGENGKKDTLTLSTDGPVYAGGGYRIFELVWKRV